MQPKPSFQDLIRSGYGEQLPLPLPDLPRMQRNRIQECRMCGMVHAGAYDDIVCRYESERLHPT